MQHFDDCITYYTVTYHNFFLKKKDFLTPEKLILWHQISCTKDENLNRNHRFNQENVQRIFCLIFLKKVPKHSPYELTRWKKLEQINHFES